MADIDLELRIFPQQDEGYPVEIRLGRHQVFPRGYLDASIAEWTPGGDLQADGEALRERLLSDVVLREAWSEARGQAPQRRIRLWIDVNAPELHALPWELLYDQGVMLSAAADTPFTRFLPVKLPWRGAIEGNVIRLLVAIAAPTDIADYGLTPLDIGRERAAFEEIAAGPATDYTLNITYLEPPVTLERLEAALREGYHILHYVGHGAYQATRRQAALYLQDDTGTTHIVGDDALVNMLARQDVRPQLVFLAACQSAVRATTDAFLGLGPKLIGVGLPAVVAMQDFVTVESARKLNTVFYRQLLKHGQVDRAMNAARSTLLTAGRPDAIVPVLLTRLESCQLWSAEADARGDMLGDRAPRVFWSGLMKYIQMGKCTPIIGPRARVQWLPDPIVIAQTWAKEHGYPFSDKMNPHALAQYLAVNQGEDFPRYALLEFLEKAFLSRVPAPLRQGLRYHGLSELVQAIGWQTLTADSPNDVHKVLASLDLPLYVTTNVDNFMTAALVAQGKQPVREMCRWNDDLEDVPSIFDEDPNYIPTPEKPLVYHLFGNEQEISSLVLTEDAHYTFMVNIAANLQRIHPVIRAALANSSLLFLGYRLNDLSFRVLMRGIFAPMQQRRKFKHVGVQLEPDDVSEENLSAVHDFMQDYFQRHEVNVYTGTVLQFIAELREYWEAAKR